MENFDWVSARHNCSAGIIFRLLKDHVEEDTKKRQELRPRGDTTMFRFESDTAASFFVFKQRESGVTAVKFTLQHDRIIAFDDNQRELVSASVGLDGAAGCKLFVAGQFVEEWEFRKRALDGLFFVEPKGQTKPWTMQT